MPRLRLTFDDGPDPEWTPRLLDALSALGARATFFPIAPRAAAEPGIVERILAEGHVVGVHCHEHVRHSERSADEVRHDGERALGMLRSLGARPTLWRTPYGDVAPFSEEVAGELGLRIVGWTVDTHDWRGDLAEEMFDLARPGLTDGAVVLAHDGIGPGALRSTARETVAFVRLVGAYAARHKLALEALPHEALSHEARALEARA